MLFTIELAARLQGSKLARTVCTRSGRDRLMREWPGWVRKTWEGRSGGREWASPIVRLAASRSVDGITGCYFVRERRASFPRGARKAGLARELWERSEEVVGVR